MTNIEFVRKIRLLEEDYGQDDCPKITMADVTRLVRIIDAQARQLRVYATKMQGLR